MAPPDPLTDLRDRVHAAQTAAERLAGEARAQVGDLPRETRDELDAMVGLLRALRELVPAEHQVHHREVRPVALEHLLASDPSEAVRSSEILPTLRAAGFTLPGYAGAGCALLQPVLMHQIQTFDPRNWEHNHTLTALFREEDRLMRAGVLGDDFAMFMAVPPA